MSVDGYADVLEAKAINGDKEVLTIRGQVRNYQMGQPPHDTLIIDVEHNKSITPPYTQWDRAPLGEIIDSIYTLKRSKDNHHFMVEVNIVRRETMID